MISEINGSITSGQSRRSEKEGACHQLSPETQIRILSILVKRGFRPFGKLGYAAQTFLSGLARYTTDFFVPFLISTHYFQQVESGNLFKTSPLDILESYLNLLDYNNELMGRGVSSALDAINAYAWPEIGAFLQAMYQVRFRTEPA